MCSCSQHQARVVGAPVLHPKWLQPWEMTLADRESRVRAEEKGILKRTVSTFATRCFNQPESAAGRSFTLQSSREAFLCRVALLSGICCAGLLEENPRQRIAQTLWPSLMKIQHSGDPWLDPELQLDPAFGPLNRTAVVCQPLIRAWLCKGHFAIAAASVNETHCAPWPCPCLPHCLPWHDQAGSVLW